MITHFTNTGQHSWTVHHFEIYMCTRMSTKPGYDYNNDRSALLTCTERYILHIPSPWYSTIFSACYNPCARWSARLAGHEVCHLTCPFVSKCQNCILYETRVTSIREWGVFTHYCKMIQFRTACRQIRRYRQWPKENNELSALEKWQTSQRWTKI